MSGNKDTKQFSKSVSHLLKRAVQYSIHIYMSEAGKLGLTHRQYTVLNAVDNLDGKSQTELVKLTGIDRSTMADLVKRLTEQGYVIAKQSREDARSNSVRLTPAGKKVLKTAQSGVENLDKSLLQHVSATDRKTVVDCLAALADKMDSIEDEVPAKSSTKVKLRRRA